MIVSTDLIARTTSLFCSVIILGLGSFIQCRNMYMFNFHMYVYRPCSIKSGFGRAALIPLL